METVDDVLAHFGVPGMKWGVRRTRSSRSSSAPSEDYIRAISSKSKPAHSLSNQEMDELIRRMDLEHRYTQALAKANLKPMTKGGHVKKFVTGLLLDVGKTEVTYVAKQAARMGTNKSPLGKALGLDKAKKEKKSKKPKTEGEDTDD